LFCVGEYWSADVGALRGYLGEEQAMSLFDVPLHFAFYHASVDRAHIDFAHMLDGAFVTADPVHAVTFVENHDTQPNQALASTVEPWFKPVAYAIVLLREAGYPCVFFADLFGLPNDAIPAVAELPLLMEVRRRFAYGTQHDYLDEPDLVGWTREGSLSHGSTGAAVVLNNRAIPEERPAESEEEGSEGTSDAPAEAPQWPSKRMYVGVEHAGETWRCVLGDVVDVEIDQEGNGVFPAAANSMVAVYLPAEAAAKLDSFPIVMVSQPCE
jgi:alpha-amylase